MTRLSRYIAVALLAAGCFPGRAAAENPTFEVLVKEGIKISEKETVKLAPAVLADGLTAAEQRKTIESLLAKRYSWEDFTRNAVVSPLLLKIAENEAEAVGRRVDVYFVAYGDLKKIEGNDLLTGEITLGGGGEQSADADWAKVLSNEELTKRGLPPPKKLEDPRYIAAELTLLDKVRLSTFTESIKTSSTDSVTVASKLATDSLKEYPNQWRAIQRDEAGRRQLGPPQPYAGMGAYLKATKLAEPEGAVLLEWHVAFAEPQGWFNGTNLLRSKLPIVVQDAVRKMRRELAKK